MWVLYYIQCASFLRQFVLRQEKNFTALYAKNIFLEVDTGLMCFEHIETKEEVNIAALAISVSFDTEKEGKNDILLSR